LKNQCARKKRHYSRFDALCRFVSVVAVKLLENMLDFIALENGGKISD
jgi:hypothetical protein